MPLPTHIPRTAIALVLDLLFPLLLTAAGGSQKDAYQAAIDLLADYQPDTAEELGLAAEVIAFRLSALRAARAAAAPDTAESATLTLLKTANALRRSEAAAQRKLDALQRPRRAAAKKAAARPPATVRPEAPPPAAAEAPLPAPIPAALARPVAAEPAPQPGSVPQPSTRPPAPQAAPNPPQHPAHTKTGAGRLIPDRAGHRSLPAEVIAAHRRGDHQGVLNAIVGAQSLSVSATALLGAA